MKKIIVVTSALFVLFSGKAQSQSASTPMSNKPYETINAINEITLKGLLSRKVLESDTTFKWFKNNYALGMADASAVQAFQQRKDKIHVVIFGGTWCEDTQNLLPVFYRLADKSGLPDSSITLIGVDRNKQTLDNLSGAFNIVNVPTFIVMHDGKEIGRVVEYGKYGQIDKELGEIVNGLPQKPQP
jgi:thiol-disulfide isomerase/thioredoxin